MSKHTAGPLEVSGFRAIVDNQGRSLGHASAEEMGKDEAWANARLWATAPELLAIAVRLAALPDHSPEWLENPSVRVDLRRVVFEARATIAKATGGTDV